MVSDCAKSNHSSMWSKTVAEPGKTLTFYTFKDTLSNWVPFPSSARTDDAIWKNIVPEPLGVLGVIAT
ncbi:hypothetical protein B0H17DRAFT_1045119 [Mycena rosella]|uniref:Uncharacterized protein n=1 Tax=Mycena rosella TaxID=1033263 RepID=A0AAD7DZK6_MYCRO|nr:hypothetical protein B0H17DRAFT_1045119 [Mycena rosella]